MVNNQTNPLISPRHPGSSSENGFTEPKYYAEVIGHPKSENMTKLLGCVSGPGSVRLDQRLVRISGLCHPNIQTI